MRKEVTMDLASKKLMATLAVPLNPIGLVIFSHGTGSGRHSPRNQFVAKILNDAKIATLLLDLLSAEEDEMERAGGVLRFDVRALSSRLAESIIWCQKHPDLKGLKIGLFGASTGAASALLVAADFRKRVVALVSRGGRPDLANEALERVICPTLFLVGEADPVVLELNRRALAKINGETALAIVKNATHLFEEPGTLEEAAALSKDWFLRAFSRN